VGAIVMTKVEQGEMDQAQLQRWLDGALVREDDRALFELAENRTSRSPENIGTS